jgi:hypothetical protein
MELNVDKIIVRETSPNVFEQLPWGTTIYKDGVQHPWQIIELWSDQQLAAEHIYRVTPATVPGDKILVFATFARNAQGVVEQVLTLTKKPVTAVSPRQIRLALTLIGLRQQVEDYVNAQDITVQDSWHYSTEFERDHPLMLACKKALNKTDEDLDALFALAASL